MQIFSTNCARVIFSVILLAALSSNSVGDTILDAGTVDVSAPSGGGFLGGTSTFTLSAADIPDVELFADFSIVDAGVEVRVNGTSLFPLFNDVSQFSPDVVFLDTGVTQGNGNIDNPFSPNSNSLPRLIITSNSDDTLFGGAATPGASSTIDYTPNFTSQDFSSLLLAGQNTIEFFVLNSFEGADLQGNYTVSLIAESVPEPSSVGFAFLALLVGMSRRYRS